MVLFLKNILKFIIDLHFNLSYNCVGNSRNIQLNERGAFLRS